MDKLFFVAVGGGVGAVMRYLLGVASLHRFGMGWPVGTFLANVSGGLLMGLLVGWLAQRGGADQERLRLLLGVGLLGGFTTFSAFSLETALMIERRAYGEAFGYALVSVLLSVTALFTGLMLMRRFADA
ncbi:MAG: fluoride efflux transporter CrcB [Phenylobacterium sp.]|uniref:fluoride efflux transporter CrcB n=1 Tax=Phenylobacterium sp. TaxID=1871053 RepID=UPI00272598DD|nr:fluoride efflux transporter CrcB [Phenylobacterium sp.]MDO8410772.1 fluoride efflux transporter CrcB [Phenylobacterium sp.]